MHSNASSAPAFTPPSTTLLAALAIAITWLVWGSSFAAIDLALEAIPPLLLMASRFVAAGIVALAVGLVLAYRAGDALPGRAAWLDAAICGTGFVTIGMGATGWASTRLDSGTTALLVASAPVWIALLSMVSSPATRPNRAASLGMLMGMVGVAAIVVPTGGGGASPDPLAAAALVAATIIWAAASIYRPRAQAAPNLLVGTGMQMLIGGSLLLAACVASGELARFDGAQLSPITAVSWVWLTAAASIGGFVAYGWLLANRGATVASTHAFVNPVVAVAIGALLLGERPGVSTAAAGVAITAAVVLLLYSTRLPLEVIARPRQACAAPRRRMRGRDRVGSSPLRGRQLGTVTGWHPAPTPRFAARRSSRPMHATDGMDALAIDEAFDRLG